MTKLQELILKADTLRNEQKGVFAQYPDVAGIPADQLEGIKSRNEQIAAIDGEVKQLAEIEADVRARGDAAVLEMTARFDGVHAVEMRALEIGAEELSAALAAITPAQRSALAVARAATPPDRRSSGSARTSACVRSSPCWCSRARPASRATPPRTTARRPRRAAG
jgi:hypothetical protein